jgi:alkanesulfonate monooxygenase SsuD/methylene tetrahydromethanopterin reductase-like flavin-dependent oxidoreductase (luciferase family)
VDGRGVRGPGRALQDRGATSDEQLTLLECLWTDERCQFEGRHYRFRDVAFYPKPLQTPRVPIWVGGEGAPAQRRAARYGDAWFPYFVRIAPRELAVRFDNVRRWAREAGRDPARIGLSCCLPIELTSEPMPQQEGRLRGSAEQLTVALRAYGQIGVEHLALQFMVPRWPERRDQIERFAREVMPALRNP